MKFTARSSSARDRTSAETDLARPAVSTRQRLSVVVQQGDGLGGL